jgi:long-chain acyl-CoA synthetase
MLVDHFLEQSARAHPEKLAIVSGSRRISYAELEQQSNRLAHTLQAAGIRRYDRVAVYLDNSIEAAVAIFGALKAAAVFTVIHPSTKSGKLARLLNDCRAAAVVTDGPRLRQLSDAAPDVPHLRMIISSGVPNAAAAGAPNAAPALGWPALGCRTAGDDTDGRALSCPFAAWEDALAREPESPPAKMNIDVDLAALIYTSGTTGAPKSVMMTHRSIVAAANSVTEYLENTADDVILNVLPLSFGYGLYQLLMAAKIGGTLVLEPHFSYPHRMLEIAANEGVTGFPIIPTISAILLQMDLSKYPLRSLRYITSAAAALPVEHIRTLRAYFPNVKIFSMYGLTECKRVAYLPPDQLDIRPTSVGRAIPNEEVYIVDEDGVEVPPNVVGELVVRGSHVMSGYWERPEDTARALRPGRFPGERVLFTGDMFRQDAEGYLYFVARKDDIIKTRGQKVSPCEVENVLASIDGVAEAAVVGVPDPVVGQAIKAFVTLRRGVHLNENDILRQCSQQLEDYMMPKVVEIRAELPKTANGKIDKAELLELEGARA